MFNNKPTAKDWQYTASTAGTFAFFCNVHGYAAQHGTLVVQAPSGGGGTTTDMTTLAIGGIVIVVAIVAIVAAVMLRRERPRTAKRGEPQTAPEGGHGTDIRAPP